MRTPERLVKAKTSPRLHLLSSNASVRPMIKKIDDLENSGVPVMYPEGSLLFAEGHPAKGVFILRSGAVKLSACSREGRTVIVSIAGRGDILGLADVFSGIDHDLTAEAIETTEAAFLGKTDFLNLMRGSEQIGLTVVRQLSRDCHSVYDNIRCLSASSISERMAKLIVHWLECPMSGPRSMETSLRVPLTHEEIAQSIGSTRETVSRTLMEFRQKRLISINGTEWTITNGAALHRLAAA